MRNLVTQFRDAVYDFILIFGEFHRKYRWHYLLASLLIVISSILLFPVPFITRRLIDVVSTIGSPGYILRLLIFAGVFLFAAKLASFSGNVIFYKLTSKVTLLLRTKMLERVFYADFDTLRKYETGYLLARINEDPGYLNTLFGQQLIGVFQNILLIIVAIVGLLITSIKLFLITAGVFPILVWVLLFFGRRMRGIFPAYLEAKAVETSYLEESLNLIGFLKLSLREIVGIRRFFSKALKTHRINESYGRYYFGNDALTGVIVQFTPILIFGVGGYMVLRGKMSLGTLIGFNMFMGYLFVSLNALLSTNITLQIALSAMERVKEILAFKPEEKSVFAEPVNSIELKDVEFAYGKSPVILEGVNMKIDRGDKVGIIGESGSGKTTLLGILSGRITGYKGKILINGKEVSSQEVKGLRYRMVLVSQEPLIVRGTIEYNLKLLNPLVENEKMVEIMRKLRLHNKISSLPEGYGTVIGFKERTLSAGEKQRIAFARAYLKFPEIMLLDEITSNLDKESEDALISVISEMHNVTMFIVSHKDRTLAVCNKIYSIDEGIMKREL